MNRYKYNMITCLVMLLTALWSIGPPAAQAIDGRKIPHYFGPYPNWALSPLPTVNPDGSITGGIKKFVDTLPGWGASAANNLGQYLPVAVADTTTYPGSDYYEIGLVQYRMKMHSNLPATLLRGYVQISTAAVPGERIALTNALLNGTTTPVATYRGVTPPHYLGPVIVATKDKPVRILFRNLLPTGAGGDLFLPVDTSMMGSGKGQLMADPPDLRSVTDMVRNPECTTTLPKPDSCFKDDRATLHLHGGVTPWISDGTPHQWITPAGETTAWPKGVSVMNVPDMPDPGPGAMTFFYTNQQSARLMFYHDHSWGITRLNVYAGEAALYLIGDTTEKALLTAGLIPGAADTIPIIVQDKTFVPSDAQMYGDPAKGIYGQDPTWDKSRWGGLGSLWQHHVYMPAQNPGDPGGMSAYGRWMYGPWFWPPATPMYPPITNPRYNMNPNGPDGIFGTPDDFTTRQASACNLDVPATWQYQVDPFCEPEFIPGTPNLSVGMEQFNDTPIVNGTAYPTVTLQPKTYRLRVLNAANDRFFNFQWYVADTTGTEVALNADELAAAQLDPVVFPTPDTALSPVGPSWIQIGSEGGFLPAPVVIPNQPTTWITDPTRFDVGNVDQHSLLLAPAERADVIVDFSKYAGKTLILYNDAPAAFPARVATYDYYTGSPDLSPNGAPGVLPGYGPNTRTIMQVKIAGTPAAAFNLTALQNAFKPKSVANPTGQGVFQNGQPPIIVGQAAYNSAYGTNFASGSWCNAPNSTSTRCDGLVRISDQGGTLFGFNTLLAPTAKLKIPMQPKAIHDEMNAVAFDEFGRMTANLGVEASPATPGLQNVTLYPYVNPVTELIDATNLPKINLANSNVNITPIATQDGTQIWRITHNGVDTHPIHFHLYDVQVLNRVTWDNIIIPTEASELGWKDTVRMSPLEDTIVALRPIIPSLPFELPNSIRMLNPMLPEGSSAYFNNMDPMGNPTAMITNQLVNFGWEYVYHCHILSHEEMDMMRPVSIAVPPKQADGLAFAISGSGVTRRVVLSWNDNSINETSFLVQKSTDGKVWTDVGISPSPLDQPNTTGKRTMTDPTTNTLNVVVNYRVVAQNSVGYGAEFPSMTVKSVSNQLTIVPPTTLPNAPSSLLAKAGPAGRTPARVTLTWNDNSTAPAAETGFTIERALNSTFTTGVVTFTTAANATATASFIDATAAAATTYFYRVKAFNGTGSSAWSNSATVTTPGLTPEAPANLTAAARSTTFIIMSWGNVTNETGFNVWRSPVAPAAQNWTLVGTTAANTLSFRNSGLIRGTAYLYKVQAVNGAGVSPFSNTLTTSTLP